MGYKWCSVPLCTNTSTLTPEKLFVSVPKDAKKRSTWLKLARRDPTNLANNSVIFFCEDHFDMEKDMANYIQFKMGFSNRIKMGEGALPSKFDCQLVRGKGCPPAKMVVIEPVKGAKRSIQRIKLVDSQPNKRKMRPTSLECLKTKDVQEFECINQSITLLEDAKNGVNQTNMANGILVPNFLNLQDQENVKDSESSFRTISIEVLKTELIDDEDIVSQEVENYNNLTTDSDKYPLPFHENKMTIESHQPWNKSTPDNSFITTDNSVEFCVKPKFRSETVQTKIVNGKASLSFKHSTISRSTSPLSYNINTNVCNVATSIQEIRELETSVRLSDRKLYRSWESVKDSKDPETYEKLLDEVKNKQNTLSCMVQLIENRRAILLKEQEDNEAEDVDAVVPLPARRHQDTRRGFKRKKRVHEVQESRSDHKAQTSPKQVTLYITGSSTIDETESTRSSTELPSLEVPQGPKPNIMFLTTNLT